MAPALHDFQRDERVLHDYMEWFCKKHAPDDKREAAEFYADLTTVMQVLHRDASRETHKLLANAIALMPHPFMLVGRSDPTDKP